MNDKYISIKYLIPEVWNKNMNEIESSSFEEGEIVLVSYFVKITYL